VPSRNSSVITSPHSFVKVTGDRRGQQRKKLSE